MKLFQPLLLLGCVSLCTANPVQMEAKSHSNLKRDNTSDYAMVQLSSDSTFHFEILRDMSLAPYEGSDIGEVLTAAHEIKPGDFESYSAAFNSLASRVHKQAKAIDSFKHPISARNAFFKASTYYRSASFFLLANWTDPRIDSLWELQLTSFNAAMALMPIPGQRVNLHAKEDNFTIPIIFFDSGLPGPRPTIIMGNGYDGSQEEMYHVLGQAALQRGINVITYEGPGQPTVRREQNRGFFPQWENVVTPIVDYALTRSEVRSDAIGLMGFSFGGFLAPRAAAFEHRLAAVITVDGLYDFGQAMLEQFPEQAVALFKSGNATLFDSIMKPVTYSSSSPSSVRWGIQQGLWAFNTESPFEWLTETQEYSMKNFTQDITTPIFVANAQNDQFFPGQAKVLADQLGSLATFHNFKAIDGAGEHCSLGASVLENQVLLDWFEDVVSTNETNNLV